MRERYLELERRLAFYLKKRSIFILCYAMGIVYFWFGALKLAGMSPADALVAGTTEWITLPGFDFFLGAWETLIGVCFFIPRLKRLALWLVFLHFPGTFLPLFLNPEACFTIIPFGLTLEGQYVIKNIVNVAAGLVLIASLHPSSPEINK